MSGRIYNVLFLCTGNSARSIMAECAINHWGQGRFRGFSAGSHPTGVIHPMTIELLTNVCDRAAAEPCPFWPGQPMTAHWGAADPAAFVGNESETRRFFYRIYSELENRIKIFTSLRVEALDGLTLQRQIREIGKIKLPENRD